MLIQYPKGFEARTGLEGWTSCCKIFILGLCPAAGILRTGSRVGSSLDCKRSLSEKTSAKKNTNLPVTRLRGEEGIRTCPGRNFKQCGGRGWWRHFLLRLLFTSTWSGHLLLLALGMTTAWPGPRGTWNNAKDDWFGGDFLKTNIHHYRVSRLPVYSHREGGGQ